MSDLVTRAEVLKLARTLEVAPAQVRYLESLGAEDLRRLREQISATLFDQDRRRFRRLARLSRILPAAWGAWLAECAFGPLVAARVAGLLPPRKAVAIAARLPVMFLADLAVELDPRRVRDVLVRIPVHTVVDVANELVEREDHVTIGRFVEVLPDEALQAMLRNIRYDEALLRILFYVERPEALDRAIAVLPPERLPAVMHAALNGSAEVRVAALSLLSRVGDALRTRLGDLGTEEPAPVLEGFVTTAIAEGAVTELLTVIFSLSPAGQDKVARLPVFADQAVLRTCADAAAKHGLRSALESFAQRMDHDARRTLARLG